ncbi:MAG: amidohydrolase family protein [Acidobacteria bacterium]|nr:amidohydrolase family protein [Acidobacteriota bacterium]MCA1651242.1 amidohydrolase family protein [Acidobacteriota bacterium]
MRIDAHQHFWRYDPREYDWIDESTSPLARDFLPDHLKQEMDAAGFDSCVAVQARQSIEETEWLLRLADRHLFIAGVVGWVDLRSPEVERQLDALASEAKLVGVRHIVQSEPDDNFLLDPDFCRGIALLDRFGLAFDILIYPRRLPVAVVFARRFERQRFVLDHLGKPPIKAGTIGPWARDLKRLADCPNVCAKLSGLVTEADWRRWSPAELTQYLDVAFECFGADRLMIGSDWPVCTLAANYTQTMSVVIDYLANRPEAEREAVLGGNAHRFWNLPIGASALIPQTERLR